MTNTTFTSCPPYQIAKVRARLEQHYLRPMSIEIAKLQPPPVSSQRTEPANY